MRMEYRSCEAKKGSRVNKAGKDMGGGVASVMSSGVCVNGRSVVPMFGGASDIQGQTFLAIRRENSVFYTLEIFKTELYFVS